MTATMCKEGSGRLGYARLLVEIDAGKEYVEKVELSYVDKQLNVKRNKRVKVEYSWKPDKCNHCAVFGHYQSQCKDNKSHNETVNGSIGKTTSGTDNTNNNLRNDKEGDKEGFVEARNRKNRGEHNGQATWNIRGMCNEIKQNEVMKFIENEKVQVCAVIETHLKTKSITKVCDRVFGNWNWISNVVHSPTCCRIVVRWNNSVVNVMVLNSCNQEILCLVETVDKRLRFYCSFVYASNSTVERRILWRQLMMNKNVLQGSSCSTHSSGSPLNILIQFVWGLRELGRIS
ncbi:hypothetical protein CTI12_AA572810 [Artemisia annua]|uniref:ATPase, F1/V1/A1 complex, alpha/beta subunit, Zinc knuckle CX2CX4HX4C n=1 Tax=Artemisia annua TaxID=35608 RepID=A0A2U1KQ32_ARTAN|nr:hypothetical protein CTI12_AA572810 [Artemisia annua]